MAKFSKENWLGIFLIFAALLIWAPLNFIPAKNTIAAIIVIGIGLYKLFFR